MRKDGAFFGLGAGRGREALSRTVSASLATAVVVVAGLGGTSCRKVPRAILEPDSGVEKVATGCKFTEGPCVDPDGNLYFSDIRNNRLMKLERGGELREFLKPSGRSNGIVLDAEGRLVVCQGADEGGECRVVRIENDGSQTVLADQFEGKPFIAPNDLCIGRRGQVYFTDPYYGPPAVKSQPSSGVYLIESPGTPSAKVRRVISNLLKPNGILITSDNRHVYVSDRGTQKLHRYRVEKDGTLTEDGIVYDFSPDRGIDGMCRDVDGNIYAAAGENATTGLFVLSPEGELLLHQPMPEFSTNVSFGGKDARDLYLTASTSVYRLRTTRRGIAWPARHSKER